LGQNNPLYATLSKYKNFFDLFGNFMGYIHFFLLDDLIDPGWPPKIPHLWPLENPPPGGCF